MQVWPKKLPKRSAEFREVEPIKTTLSYVLQSPRVSCESIPTGIRNSGDRCATQLGITQTTLSIILDVFARLLIQKLAVSIREWDSCRDSAEPVSQGSASKEGGNIRGAHQPKHSKSKQNFMLQESRVAAAEARGGAAVMLTNVACIDTRNVMGRQFKQSRVLAINGNREVIRG